MVGTAIQNQPSHLIQSDNSAAEFFRSTKSMKAMRDRFRQQGLATFPPGLSDRRQVPGSEGISFHQSMKRMRCSTSKAPELKREIPNSKRKHSAV